MTTTNINIYTPESKHNYVWNQRLKIMFETSNNNKNKNKNSYHKHGLNIRGNSENSARLLWS